MLIVSLQGKGPQADRELRRFGINTTAGVLGFGTRTVDGGWAAAEDLGQTLAVHGFGDGCYLVWPLLGPSTLRDSVGMAGDAVFKSGSIRQTCGGFNRHIRSDATNKGSFHIGEYEAFKSAAVDPYVAMRGAYIQYRSKQIKE